MKQHTASDIVFKSDLSTRARVVFMYLSYRSNKENTCFPAIKTIAKECGMAVSTIKRALSDLAEAGYIKKDPRYRDDNGQTSNLYTLTDDVLLMEEGADESENKIVNLQHSGGPGALLDNHADEHVFKADGELDILEDVSVLQVNTDKEMGVVHFVKVKAGCKKSKTFSNQVHLGQNSMFQSGEPPPGSKACSHELVKANSAA
jgi:predicted transcriptional regulator